MVTPPPSNSQAHDDTNQGLSEDRRRRPLGVAVPAGLDPTLATMFNPLGAGIRWAVDLPGTQPGRVVAILGPGVRRLCAPAAVSTAGAGFVMLTGRRPRDADRPAPATRFGVDLAVDVATSDPVTALKEATGGLADVVVDVTAMAPAAFAQTISLARPGGTAVVTGARGTTEVPRFFPDHLVIKEMRVLGAEVSAYRPALAMLASGRFPVRRAPTAGRLRPRTPALPNAARRRSVGEAGVNLAEAEQVVR